MTSPILTDRKVEAEGIDVKASLARDEAFIRTVVRAALQEMLEREMADALGAGKGERTDARLGHRSGCYGR